MAYDTRNADEVTVQLELDNGEVVQARYKSLNNNILSDIYGHKRSTENECQADFPSASPLKNYLIQDLKSQIVTLANCLRQSLNSTRSEFGDSILTWPNQSG